MLDIQLFSFQSHLQAEPERAVVVAAATNGIGTDGSLVVARLGFSDLCRPEQVLGLGGVEWA